MIIHSRAKWLTCSPFAIACLLFCTFTSNPAHAQSTQQMVILSVDMDYISGEMTISGRNFDNGPTPIVRLSQTELPIQGYNSTAIQVSVPLQFRSSAGTFPLTISTGLDSLQNASLDVTLGAAGPRGLPGQKGDTGSAGPQGLKGDKGDPAPRGKLQCTQRLGSFTSSRTFATGSKATCWSNEVLTGGACEVASASAAGTASIMSYDGTYWTYVCILSGPSAADQVRARAQCCVIVPQ